MSLPFLNLSAAWTAAGWTMVHLLWIGLLVGIGAGSLRVVLRAARPETRHAVAFAELIVLCAAALVVFAVLYAPEVGTSDLATLAAEMSRSTVTHSETGSRRPPLLVRHRRIIDWMKLETGSPVLPASYWSRLEPIVAYLPGVWLSGSLVTLGLVAAGLVGVERLRRAGRPVASGGIFERCGEIAGSIGLTRKFGVAICERVAAPIVIGIIRPVILLPSAALTGWTIEQLEMALLHELAHIRRHDNLVTLVQRLAEALLFFHPVTWWLSGWISLERELCCDRVVVTHGGDPVSYARMLASLAGLRTERCGVALGMAERPIVRRIRAILGKEGRAMRMTCMEGAGVVLSAVVVMAMTLVGYSRPPERAGVGGDGAALERLARTVAAVPDFTEEEDDRKGRALLSIAETQLQRGDRVGALITLGLVDGLADPAVAKPGVKPDLQAWMRVVSLVGSASARQKAGDAKGAKAVLERAARLIEGLDHGTSRQTYEAVDQAFDAAIAAKKTELVLDDQTEVVEGAYMSLIEASLEIGENALALTLVDRMVGYARVRTSPMNSAMLGALGAYLVKAGNAEGGRALIERSRQAALGLANPEAIAFAVPMVAQSLFEAGQIDEALAFVHTLTPKLKESAIRGMLSSLTSRNPSQADLYEYGIKLTYPLWAPKDAASAIVVLPRIVAVAQGVDDGYLRAGLLARAAYMQAESGDFTSALATTRSIPELERAKLKEPRADFHEAYMPITLGLIAGLQAKAGDRSALSTFVEAETLARTIKANDERLIAQVVIALKNGEAGRTDVAKGILQQMVPVTLIQAEPRRSRVLAMVAKVQVRVGDSAGALRTADAIRDTPGIEKAEVLTVIARWHEDRGDAATSRTLLRRALVCLEAKVSDKPPLIKVMNIHDWNRDTIVALDKEFRPEPLENLREQTLGPVRAALGDVATAVREAKALPKPRRDWALACIGRGLASRGDIAGALKLAESIESPEGRVDAYQMVVMGISDHKLLRY